MVNAFNGELQMQRDINRRMKPDSVPVGVDCTLSPVLPTSPINEISRTEFCGGGATISSSTEPCVKRVVCSPDLPVYPLTSIRPKEEVIVDSPTTQPQSAPGILQKIYRCTICTEGFNQKANFTAHLKTHPKESEDPYQCNFCGKTFAVPARLTRHYRTHTGEKPYQCEYCNKSFSVKENLSVHKRIHTKERPYKCDVCQRAFEHSGKLHRHMRIHTGERPHKCNYCSKTFIQSGQLVIHLRTHTGEKPYVCKSCNKGFTCSKQLKVHTRTHTGEKPYACDICGKSFGYNHVLKLHQVAHFGEKVYKCTICKETFTSKKSMEIHIKMAHSDSNAARNGAEGESCISPTCDKENKFEMTGDVQHARVGERSTPGPSLPNASQMAEQQRHVQQSPIFENFGQGTNNATTMATLQDHGRVESAADLKNFNNNNNNNNGFYTRLPNNNQALLAVAAVATEELVINYENENPRPHPSKFQIPAAAQYYNPVGSPSSYSDSSRSSLSPKLEIVESAEEPNVFILPDLVHFREPPPSLHDATNSVIIHVPYQGGLTPSHSTSTSPVPSSPNTVILPAKEEISLPPRKRTKMILKSMEKDKLESSNFRYNSVIHYAKAS